MAAGYGTGQMPQIAQQFGTANPIPGLSIPGIDIGNVSADTLAILKALGELNKNLTLLAKRLAPEFVYNKQQINGLAQNGTLKLPGGGTFNGILFTVIAGTANVYLSDFVSPVPDFQFLAGASSGYIPLPEQSAYQAITIQSGNATPLIATITFVEY